MSRTFSFLFIAISLWAATFSEARAQSTENSNFLVQIGQPDSLYSNVLGENRPLWIHLPNQGRLVEGQTYPVIYLLDGGAHLGALAMIQEYYSYFRLPEMVVVGISNQEHRTRDLSPTKIETRNRAAVEESGGSEAFTRFLSEELIPYIDSKYQTNQHRTLIGHSFAGLFAINTLAHHPELFKNYIALDPSVGWDDMNWLRDELPALSTSKFENKGLFVGISDEIQRFSDTLTIETVMSDTTEFSNDLRALVMLVDELTDQAPAGLSFDWKFYDQDIHGTVPMIGMRDGLIFLYDFYRLKTPSLYNDPSTPPETIAALISAQNSATTKGMGYKLGMEWDMLEMLGRMALDMEDYKRARAVFEVTVEFYPENEGAQASMMEICDLVGDSACAMEHAKKADALSGGTSYVDSLKK
ncbi:alpha/beta hydrolase [bacterium]|nr:alpha/beta hydrolase [bacterium]